MGEQKSLFDRQFRIAFVDFLKSFGISLDFYAPPRCPYLCTDCVSLGELTRFFAPIFFINLGLHIEINDFLHPFFLALVLSTFVLIAKPAMVMALVGMGGYKNYTGVITSHPLGKLANFR
ncbi:hypothetical protein [[Limnothrix rosea] IAM M-220]|uniref:hypothetical protein n=1 Tax=[Limnothrix rosea] IAM M-220 TaxID=454133 RepID=UPI000967CBF0|nr:hypothetical protein [[Limnothrix rosea] IAM M-220]OKH11513.1 hypothetical protein NIES208_17135 [[Limnothrix rosea] IAM M-220]